MHMHLQGQSDLDEEETEEFSHKKKQSINALIQSGGARGATKYQIYQEVVRKITKRGKNFGQLRRSGHALLRHLAPPTFSRSKV